MSELPSVTGYSVTVRRNEFGQFTALTDDHIVRNTFERDGAWEPILAQFLRERCFPKGVGTYIDVGAHIGMTLIPVAKKHPGVVCYGFEPNPLNYSLLTKNAVENDLFPHLFNSAASDVTGHASLLLANGNTVDHRLNIGKQGGPGVFGEDKWNQITVHRVRIDELVARTTPRPVVVKLDAQGHDLKALRGASGLKPDIVVMEFWPYGLARDGETRGTVFGELEKYNGGGLLANPGALARWDLHTELVLSLWHPNNRIPIELFFARELGIHDG